LRGYDQTSNALIGIESKRYESFRVKKVSPLSKAYWRPSWGDAMFGYERIRDALSDGSIRFAHLDAVQLVKHAFGLRTAVHKNKLMIGKRPILILSLCRAERLAGWTYDRSIDD
jgi:hypothetical protein